MASIFQKIQRLVPNSMVVRFMLVAVIGSVVAGTSSYWLISTLVQGNIRETVVAQQTEFASYIARDVDDQLRQLAAVLQSSAHSLPPELIDQPAELDRWLAQRNALQPLFQGGLQVVPRTPGDAIAGAPTVFHTTRSTKAVGVPQTLAQPGAQDTVWQLVQAQGRGQMLMAAPMRLGHDGPVVADLVGVVDFTPDGIFTGLLNARLSSSREISLSTPQDGLVLASTQTGQSAASWSMADSAPRGAAAIENLPQGQIVANARGEDVLLSYATVESTGWRVEVTVPVSVAFAGLKRTKQTIVITNLLRITLVLAAVGGIAVWQFRPLRNVAAQAQRMTRGEEPLRPIAVVRDDEIGHLTGAFNELLSMLAAKNDELAQMAYHDSLTGLPNRKMLTDRLQQALARSQRTGQRLVLLYMDLNGFKALNDSAGHDAGDEALKQVATRLAGVVREVDTVARLGGDEFVLLAPDVQEPAEHIAQQLAEKCIAAIAEPMDIRGQTHTLGVAVGVALGDGQSAADHVLTAADNAMYEAKAQCRGSLKSACVLQRPLV